jgi:hypothetical protein
MSREKKGESTGKLVLVQAQFLQIFQFTQFCRNWTWGIQNTVTLSDWKEKDIWKPSILLHIEHSSYEPQSKLAFKIAVPQVKVGHIPNILEWELRHRLRGLHNELPQSTALCMWRIR